MPVFRLFLGLGILCLFAKCRTIQHNTQSKPISHAQWDTLLQKYVRSNGLVDYQGFLADSMLLQEYLDLLSSAHPNNTHWSKNQQMAYWINAYNAFTVSLIIKHYPLKSIKDIRRGIPFINSVWDIKFIEIEGYRYDLGNIEHNILRPIFEDARIHFAINCASFSCPLLHRRAYTAQNLDDELDAAAGRFINDPARNKINANEAQISSIFKWFSGDFKRDAQTIRNYINQYSHTSISPKATISHLPYNWDLNEASHLH